MGDTDQKILEVILELKDKLGPALGKLGPKAEGALGGLEQRMKKLGGQFTATGKKLTMGLTMPIVGLGAAVIKIGLDFDKSMRNVSALSGATGASLEKLRDQAKELGRTTVYSAVQAADAQSKLAMAGWEVEEIFSALPGILDMAAAGGLDVAASADIASNMMDAFALSADQSGRVADVLTNTFTSSNVDLLMLADTMKYVAPIAETAGWSLEATAAAAGLLGSKGIQGSMAGTALKKALSTLVSPTDEVATALEGLNIRAIDTEGAILPLADILEQFEVGLEGLGKAEKAGLIMEIFGERAGPSMAALLGFGSEALREFAEANENAAGKAEETADVMITPWERFKSAAQGAAIAISESGLLDSFTKLLEKALIPMAQKIAEMDPAQLDALTKALIGVATVGPLLVGAGSVVTAVGVLAGAASALTGPWGIAIAAVVGGGALLIANWDKIKNWAESHFPGIGETARAAMEVVQEALGFKQASQPGGMGDLKEFERQQAATAKVLQGAQKGGMGGLKVVEQLITEKDAALAQSRFDQIKLSIKGAFGKIGEFLKPAWEMIKGFFGWLGGEAMELIQPLVDWFGENMPLIKETFTKVWDAISAWFKAWSPVFAAYFKVVWENIKLIFNTVWETIKAAFKIALDVILAAFKIGMQIFTGDWEGAWNTILETGKKIWGHLVEWWDGVSGGFEEWFTNLKTVAPQLWSDMWTAIRTTIEGYIKDISGSLQGLWTFIVNIFKGGSKEVVGESIWPDMWEAIEAVANDSIPRVLAATQDLTDGMTSKFQQLARNVGTAMKDVAASILTTISDIMGQITAAIGAAESQMQGLISQANAQGGWQDLADANSPVTQAINAIRGAESGIANAMPKPTLPTVQGLMGDPFSTDYVAPALGMGGG